MRLAIHSNASYLSEPKACSRASGHMFMAGMEDIPINSGTVLNISQIIRAVMSSAVEAKLGSLFINTKTAVSMQCTLEELGHLQITPPFKPTIRPHMHYSPTNSAQGVEGHGYAIPLVALPQGAGPVSILLETWSTKFGRLLDQASSSQPATTNLFGHKF
jgi:hypothetical protein